MTKEAIKTAVRNGISGGILSIDDMLVDINRYIKERIIIAIKESGGKISFTEECPRIVSCCFNQVLELDVKEIQFDNDLHFICEEPEAKETYMLDTEDFLIGELRHVLSKIKKEK